MTSGVLERLSQSLSDRYRVERELGAGGMATVYLAHDLRHDRDVAIKVLHEDLGASLGPERFLAEIKTTAKLQHPHILPLLDSGTSAGLLYYVMPFVAGETLRDRLAHETQLPIEDAVRIAREVADALGFAHSHGIIHRDIKPENILLQGGHALVADFGIALAVQHAGGPRLTQSGLSLGTPQYMSPEQAMGEKTVDHHADIYALGAVTYEMLTGDPPFTGSSVQAIVAKVLSSEPERPTTIRKTIPSHVESAVLKALAKLPADRWASPTQFSEALSGSRAEVPLPGTVSSSLSRQRNFAVAGAAIAVLASIALVLWAGISRDTSPRPMTKVVLDVPESPRQNNQWGVSVHLAPNKTGVFYSGRGGKWFRPFDSLGARPIAETSGEGFAPSPDGRYVAVRKGPWVGKLYVVPIEGGGQRLVSDSVGPSVTWGPDDHFYFRATDLVLARVSERGGPIERLTSLDAAAGESFHEHATVLPGGRGLLFTVGYQSIMGLDKAVVSVLDLRTRQRRSLFPGFSPKYTATGHLVFATTDGTLRAVRFDERTLQPLGTPVPVVHGVKIGSAQIGADYDLTLDGDLVYVTAAAEGRHEIVWVTRDGRVERTDSTWPGRVRGMALSPDGRRLAVSLLQDRSANNIWLRDLPDGAPTRLTSGNVVDAIPRWTPDGSALIYSGPRPPARLDWDLYLQPVTGGPDSLLVNGVHSTGLGVTSPDGTRLVWMEGGAILTRRVRAEEHPVPLVAKKVTAGNPAISPDGRWLSYNSNETGRTEVYVRHLDPSNSAQWQVSVAGGSEPRWGVDSRTLFFIDSARTLTQATLEAGTGIRVVSRQPLFSTKPYATSGYEVRPRNEGFLFVRVPYDRGWGDMILIQGFAQELRRRVDNGASATQGQRSP